MYHHDVILQGAAPRIASSLPPPAMAKTSDIILIIIAILFPPAAAGMITGCSCDLLINILLTILGYFPGHLHAFWLIYKKMQAEERYGVGGFLYVGNGVYEPIYQVPGGHVHYGATGP